MTLQLSEQGLTSSLSQKQQQQQQTNLRECICQCGCGQTLSFRVSKWGKPLKTKLKRFTNQAHQVRAWRHNNPDKVRAFRQASYKKRNAGKIYKVRYQYQNPQKYCRRCNALLNPGLRNEGNWRPSDAKRGNYDCKKCINKLWPETKKTPEQIRADGRVYYHSNIEKRRAYSRNYYYSHKSHKLEYMRQYRLRKKAEKEK